MKTSKSSPGRSLPLPHLPEGVAATLLLRFMRDPFTSTPEPRLDDLTMEEKQALEAVAASLGISIVTMLASEGEQRRVRNALVHGLSGGPLSPIRATAARERLGSAGLLSPSEYRLEFPDILRVVESLGDRQTYIENAVRNADSVQHLSPTGKTVGSNTEGVSLFVRKVDRHGRDRFAHLVVMSRKSETLRFQAAWRVYSDVVPWDAGMSPLALLERFVQRYGMPFEIPGRSPTRFVLYEVIPWTGPATSQKLMRPIFDMTNKDHDFVAGFTVKVNEGVGVVEIALGYIVDTTLYRADVEARSA